MEALIKQSFFKGKIEVPASKSYLHRALIAASLAEGPSRIMNFTISDDIQDTINALVSLGVGIDIGEHILVTPKKFTNSKIKLKESGTTYRMLIPILSSMFRTFDIEVMESLYNRPINIYEELGLVRKGMVHNFDLSPGVFEIDGSISSQFVSGLLYTLPLLDGDSILNLKNRTSENYIMMTLDVLEEFGIVIKRVKDTFYIKGNQKYSGITYTVEPDFSAIAFWAVAGFVNGDIFINAPEYSLQPDFALIKLLRKIGKVDYDSGYRFVKQTYSGFKFDVNNSPDLAPALSLLACFASSESTLSSVSRLIYKESNRIEGILDTLGKLGANIEYDGEIKVLPSNLSYNNIVQTDHRIAMMAAIAATKTDVLIKNIESINKSYPNFINDLISVGVNVEVRKWFNAEIIK